MEVMINAAQRPTVIAAARPAESCPRDLDINASTSRSATMAKTTDKGTSRHYVVVAERAGGVALAAVEIRDVRGRSTSGDRRRDSPSSFAIRASTSA